MVEAIFGAKDLVPLWVADMDFASPPEVVRALLRRVEHVWYGYTECTDGYYDALTGWMRRRHGWDVRREWVVPCPGVVPALNTLVRAFTRPGIGSSYSSRSITPSCSRRKTTAGASSITACFSKADAT